ncbi:hypothetical protein BCR34DRAFT_586032 [Clohesyomyces aquaticus]|uniref:Beta/gamma crystallin 'Greek key' domain-containing protein n=1 Tax=Clohesyomyces aquaticus TaxID=1231657 RepID=A0A1Y1ZVG7_9PLEO|nr:hypothetical protein BCR34DRAFT_586032 [Clohesyomyces aquaticus]
MKYLALASILALASSAPSPIQADIALGDVAEVIQSPAAVTTFTYCKDKDFKNCRDQNPIIGTCYNVIDSWDNVASSVRPGVGVTCYIYENKGCSGRDQAVVAPGISNLQSYAFNDIMSSYKCI